MTEGMTLGWCHGCPVIVDGVYERVGMYKVISGGEMQIAPVYIF